MALSTNATLGAPSADGDVLQIREIQKEDLSKTLPLLSTLYQHLSPELMTSRLAEIAELNWRCVGVFDHGALIGLSGYWLNTRLYCGKYLYIDHFVIDADQRRRGVGALLLNYLKKRAEDERCEHVCLDTFVSNSLAQAYWARHGFNIVGFHYIAK